MRLPEPDRQNDNRRVLLNDANRELDQERQAAVVCNSSATYEPHMRRTIWKLMVGSHVR